MTKIQKNDFIELNFTGRVKGGDIFDTNILEDARKIDLKLNEIPFIICIGQRMVVSGLDNALEDKEIGKKYIIELTPKQSFGERRAEFVRLIPKKVFLERNINPKIGMVLALDNNLSRIVSISGGRILVDFNNPLSSKTIVYEFIIKRKIEELDEKINSLLEYFLKQKTNFKIEDKMTVVECEQIFKPMIKIINDKFKDVLNTEFIIKE